MKTPSSEELQVALTVLDEASRQYIAAQERSAAVRRDETDCMNALNGAQKQVDEMLQKIRSSAPQGSDWARRLAP